MDIFLHSPAGWFSSIPAVPALTRVAVKCQSPALLSWDNSEKRTGREVSTGCTALLPQTHSLQLPPCFWFLCPSCSCCVSLQHSVCSSLLDRRDSLVSDCPSLRKHVSLPHWRDRHPEQRVQSVTKWGGGQCWHVVRDYCCCLYEEQFLRQT